ncbi:MAG TPA: amidohydrolase family protein [Blastocatellia bacterium]
MTYGANRTYNDADSHIMETLDWVSRHADDSVRERLLPLGLSKAGTATYDHIAAQVARVKDPVKTAEIDHDVVSGPKGWSAYGAFDPAERSRALDDLGFSRQLVFSTFAGTQYWRHDDFDVRYGGIRAHNRAMAEFCKVDDRLIPVGQVSLADTGRAVAEIKEAVRLGCGAVWVPAGPAGDRSPGHIDLDPVWQTFCDLKTPFVLHVDGARPLLPPEYNNNGRPRPTDQLGGGENLRIKDFMTLTFAPQQFLSAMVFDGVFQRFPDLRGGVIELGGGWVPEFLRTLDRGQRSFGKTDPLVAGLEMPASDYIRRAVKFTPFATEDVGRMIRDAGPDLFLFSSDYPHPEGTTDPIGRFERGLEGMDEEIKEKFYCRNFQEIFAAPAR